MKTFFAVLAFAAVAYATPEADADPALLYGGLGYASPYLGYTNGYTPYNNYLNAFAGYTPYSFGAYSTFPYATTAYNPYFLNNAYAFAGKYVAKSAPGVVHIAKREAEAEADPALLYSSLGYPTALNYAAVAGAYRYPYAATAYNPYYLNTYKTALPYSGYYPYASHFYNYAHYF